MRFLIAVAMSMLIWVPPVMAWIIFTEMPRETLGLFGSSALIVGLAWLFNRLDDAPDD